MKKISLHWQILATLILAIIFGISFPTHYVLNNDVENKLIKKNIPVYVIHSLHKGEDLSFNTLKSFQKEIRVLIGSEDYDKYFHQIQKSAYYNPAVNSVSWMGDLFLRLLKMLIIPLVVSSLISGITNIGSGDNLGRLGLKTMSYYIFTSILAIITGLFLVNLIHPGTRADMSLVQKVEGLAESQPSFKDLLLNVVPDNIITALSRGDMLSIIFFAMIFGFFITRVNKSSREFLSNLFNGVFDVMMKMTMFIIRFTPLGILGIVAKVVADQDDLVNLVSSMGLYMGTVILALSIHAFVSLPLIMKFIGKAKPFRHFKNMSTPLLTAFSTSSSGATLPLTMAAVEKNSGVSNKISSFTLPLGATINMDGTALYECVAALFIAQAYGVDLTIIQQLIVVATALLASIGAAAIPMAGLVMITVILTAVNLPLEGVGLILAVDRILDMFRTATNVWSDSCGAVVIAKSEGEELSV
jgi:proton glutamate symport protein